MGGGVPQAMGRHACAGLLVGSSGHGGAMRFGRNVQVRPLGGGRGCLGMILFSIIASVVLTVVLNLVVRAL
jgi:putative effector of murein hydrolase